MKLSEVTGDAPPTDAAKRMKLSEAGGVAPDRNDTRGKARFPDDSDLSVFDRLWRGLSGNDVTVPGQVAKGMANPFYKGAQIGARMMAEPGGGVPEQAMAPPGPDRTKEVDTAVQQREERYTGQRKAAGQETDGFFNNIWEKLGEVASPVTLAAGGAAGKAMGAAGSAVGRIGLGAAGGAAIAPMTTPVTDTKNFGEEITKEAAGGAIGGGLGAAAGEIGGSLLGNAIARGSAEEIDRATLGKFRATIKPGRPGRASEGQLKTQDRQILSAVDDIIGASRQPGGAAMPTTIREFGDRIDQTKRSVFQQYDQLKQGAAAEELGAPNPHLVEGFRRSGAATQQAANEVRDAQNAVTMTAAAQHRAGDNVYMSSIANNGAMVARQKLAQATQKAGQLQARHQQITSKMYTPFVDLAPMAARLKQMAGEPRYRDFAPGIAAQAEAEAGNLAKRGFYSLTDAQSTLELLNNRLSAFYRNPTPATASKAIFDAEVAGMIRRGLDETITNLKGPGYQALRNRYGALKAVEKDVAGAVQREANKIPGGIGGIFADLWAVEHGLKFAFTGDPHAFATAMATKSAQAFLKKIRDPNRAIAQLFARRSGAQASSMGPFRAGAEDLARRGSPMAGAATGTFGAVQATRPQRGGQNDVAPPAAVR